MIYLSKHKTYINVPRHSFKVDGEYTLTISSPVSDDVTIVENGGNISTKPLYYKFNLDSQQLLNIPDGEYTYKLIGKYNTVLEVGLIMIGTYDSEDVVNNTFNLESKIQYHG
jgi:hypothetical protein